MIAIHQAIYGEVLGKTSGHDLLAASDNNKELFKRISGYTDLADRPEGGVLPSPIIRGFCVENHFLLIKTFPDKNPKLRSGRVFSHVLLIAKSDLVQVHSLSDLFQYHMSSIQKEAEMHLLKHQSPKTASNKRLVNEREAAATNALFQNLVFVWLGEEGYWEWMAKIWPQLPTKVKYTLKIGAAFGPSYARNEYLNILYIPKNVKALWERHSFKVINLAEKETLRSTAAHWLMGDTKEGEPFQVLLDDFNPKIESFEQLNKLQDYGEVYHRLDNNPKLNHLLVLARFVSLTSPDERTGVKGKNKLISAILQAIPNSPANKFTALMYQSWKGFPNAIASVSEAVCNWLNNHLLRDKYANESVVVLVTVLESDTNNWWGKTVLGYITDRLKTRQLNDAQVFWQWMISEPTLITKHLAWLPTDVENELTKKIPKLEKAVAELVLRMAEQKSWLVLHARVAAEYYPVEKAIKAQLRIDTNEDHTVALEALSKSIKRSAFVPVAANQTDARLHHIVGKLVAQNSKLLKGINIASEGWQACWEVAIKQGNEVWSGISNPQHTFFEILDHLLAGNSFSEYLLNVMSTGKHSSLKDFPGRASIWQKLPTKARSGFIVATLAELIDELATGQIHYHDLEIELKNGVQSQEIQQQIISSKTITLTKKLRLFNVLPSLRESHALQLMQAHNFSRVEANEFGQLVSTNKWQKVVDALYNKRSNRQDLVPALLQCTDLLSLLQRFSLSISGVKADAITLDEWWQVFLSVAVELYPLGPTQNGLWLNAGGKLEEIHYQGISGKQSWSFAIIRIRSGGTPSAKKLLEEMKKENHSNPKLKKLIQLL
ncbi:MAG: hypothetical protein AAFO95_09095 [Cyanobacteria bacterium J06600_6]